jgi:DDE superfamily endonuclease/Helix-turn-helix of DDE superfamily endonuclease
MIILIVQLKRSPIVTAVCHNVHQPIQMGYRCFLFQEKLIKRGTTDGSNYCELGRQSATISGSAACILLPTTQSLQQVRFPGKFLFFLTPIVCLQLAINIQFSKKMHCRPKICRAPLSRRRNPSAILIEVLSHSKSTQTLSLVEHDASCQTTPSQTKDVVCEANIQKFSLMSLIKSDHTLKIWTGLDGFPTLHVLTEIVSQVESCRGTKRLLLDVKERIVMTLIVIRHGIQYNLLSTLFGVAQSTISRHFHTTLLSLSEGLHSLIYWPTDEENIKSMPVYFIGHFEDTKVVLDCTECKIEMFKCLKCRIESYSNYKSSHTAKYLLGVTPCGTFSYVSRGYPGRASDKYIFNKENVAALLAPGVDAVMIDKGFSIETELANAGNYRFSDRKTKVSIKIIVFSGAKMYRPPFLRGKTQFSKEEAEENVRIAAARVHVERAIQRVKQFKLLKGTVGLNHLGVLDHIMVVSCALVNLQAPILADKRY